MIGVRCALLFLVALCVVGFACVATANMIQNRPTGETVFDNGGQRWPFFSQVAVANYDKGGQGVGYNVPTPDPVNCSAGASYRADAVNLKTSVAGAPAIPFQIGCNGSPNSFNYSINISQAGPYQITLQLADTSAGGSEAVLLDGVQVASVPTPNTGSFDTFASSTSGPFTASLGNHLLTLKWGAGDTMFNGAGDMLTWQGSQAPPTAINSVSISCGNSCTFAPGTAGTVGRAQATMSIGSFAGSWSLRTSGTDNFGATCNNYGGGFAINGSTGDVSNGALAAGSYPGVCLVATQAGAGGSPFALAVTITGTGCAAPSVAAAAGFCTEAANYDFSQPSYGTLSNWLETSFPNSNTSLPWHCSTHVPCNIHQTIDPSTGQTVLTLNWLNSYSSFGQTGNPNNVQMATILNECGGGEGCQGLTFPNKYVETVYRLDNTNTLPYRSGPDGVWQWEAYATGSGAIEVDFGEVYTDTGANGTVINWGNGNSGGYAWCNWGCGATSPPAGYSVANYHKYGVLYTSDGATSVKVCFWVDDVFEACIDASALSSQYLNRPWLIAWVGGGPNGSSYPPNTNEYIQYIRVWSCANWALSGGATWSASSANQCNGSTLFNSGGLTYWH